MNDHVGRPSIRLQTGVTQRNTQYGRNRNTSEFPGRHDLSPELIVRNIYRVKIMYETILSVVDDLDIDIVS